MIFKKTFEKGYKICTIENGEFTSATPNALKTQYRYDIWTERKNNQGPFAVFSGLEYAVKFLDGLVALDHYSLVSFPRKRVILSCDYKISKEHHLWYKTKDKDFIDEGIDTVPKGTIFADKVRLTMKLW
jgi:hypothetical protein